VIRGNGSNKLTGMLNTAPTSRDDFDGPLRTAAAYEFVTDGDSPYTVDADTLISLFYKVNSAYRANATWVFNNATAGVIRKLKENPELLSAFGRLQNHGRKLNAAKHRSF
jgi:HK97 family phage major capsid protein